jgi:hypothetical protein
MESVFDFRGFDPIFGGVGKGVTYRCRLKSLMIFRPLFFGYGAVAGLANDVSKN